MALAASQLDGVGSVLTGGQPPTGGTGTGTVQSVTGAAAGIVDNTDPDNPVIQAQFGEDTTVDLAGLAAALQLTLTRILTTSLWSLYTKVAGVKTLMVALGSIGGSPGVHLPEGGLLGLKNDGATGILYTLAGGIRMFILGNQKFQLSPTGALVLAGAAPGIGASGGGNFTISGSTLFDARQITSGQGTSSLAAAGLLILNNLLGNNYAVVIGASPTTYIATSNWNASSRVMLSLPAGYTVNNAGGAPPANYAPILLRAGVNLVTGAPYMLDLVYDGTNWVQPG